jgi:NAD(P)-dependent dehydrogenase (short-subunit alcohol dehydrogenase family)
MLFISLLRFEADGRFNNAGIAGEGSREGYEKSDDVEKFSQQLLRSEFKEWDDILRTNVTAHYVRLSLSSFHLLFFTLFVISTLFISRLLFTSPLSC